MKKETPTEKYLREILELLKLKASQPIFPPYNGACDTCPHNWTKRCCGYGSNLGHTGACQYFCDKCGKSRNW